MVVHVHPVLDHRLVGSLIQADGEGDGVFLFTSHIRYAKAVRVKIAHVLDGRVPLVEGPPIVNECPSNFLIRSRRILCRPGPLDWVDVRTKNQPIGGPPSTINCERAYLARGGGASVTSKSEASINALST